MKVYKVSTSYQSCLYDNIDEAIEELKMLILELDSKITIEELEMTEEEFNNCEEFTGW
jgi:hypothetical protein